MTNEQRLAIRVRVERGHGLSHQDASALWDRCEALQKLLVDRTAECHVLRDRAHALANQLQGLMALEPGPYAKKVSNG